MLQLYRIVASPWNVATSATEIRTFHPIEWTDALQRRSENWQTKVMFFKPIVAFLYSSFVWVTTFEEKSFFVAEA